MKKVKKYGIFHVPVLAFFSRALYRDVALNWKGVAFGYLLLLLALCWVPRIIAIHRGMADFVDNEAPAVVSQFPVLTIANGEASVDVPEPHTVYAPDSETPLIVFDTTGTINSLEETEAIALVTRYGAEVQKNAYEQRAFSFREVDRFTLTQDKIYHWLDIGKRYFAPVIYPFCVLGSYAYRILQALIYAALGLLLAWIFKIELPYDALLRLAVVAVTPVIIVTTLLKLVHFALPLAWLWCFIAAMGYLAFGILAAKPAEEPNFKFSDSAGNS